MCWGEVQSKTGVGLSACLLDGSYFRGFFELAGFVVRQSGEGEGQHLEGEDFDDGKLEGRYIGEGQSWEGVIWGDEERGGMDLLEVLMELLVESGVGGGALEDERCGGGGGHFDRAMAECGAAHGFDAEPGGFFTDQGAGVGRCEGAATAEEEDVFGVLELSGESMQVAAPVTQVSGDGGSEWEQAFGCFGGRGSLDDLDEPGQRGDGGGVGFAGHGSFRAGLHEEGGGGVLVERRVGGVGDTDEVAVGREFSQELENFDALA